MHTDISSESEPDDAGASAGARKQRGYSTARDRLTPLGIKRLTEPGLHHDGGGLYLQVSLPKRVAAASTGPELNKSWVFRYRLQGKLRSMGIGSFHDLSLADAREKARKLRQSVADKIDPIDERVKRAKALAAQRAVEVSFRKCAEAYHLRMAPHWKNLKHATQWFATLEKYVFPSLGNKKVHNIGKQEILSVLDPIWAKVPETASRVKQRMKSVLDWAASKDYYPDYPHGMWTEIGESLMKPPKKKGHHAACPYGKVCDVLKALYASDSQPIVKLAFEFTVLTAARSGEVRLMPWSEYAEKESLWIIPAERMKVGKEHRVPLSARCVEILKEAKAITGKEKFAFCHPKTGKAFSDAVFTSLLHKGLGLDYTMHGFRSTFRDWGAESTKHPRELLEVALAHLPGDQTEQAYWRGDMLAKRRKLMEDWSAFIRKAPRNR